MHSRRIYIVLRRACLVLRILECHLTILSGFKCHQLVLALLNVDCISGGGGGEEKEEEKDDEEEGNQTTPPCRVRI